MTSLVAFGVDAVYGQPLDGVPVVDVDADLAPLFADAHSRVTGRRAGVHTGDGQVRDPATGGVAEPTTDTPRWTEPDGDLLEALHRASRPAVLAGPGVVRASVVPGLHALAVAGSVGVLNTWGAKGVFDWRSRHHLATVGLQGRDFVLGGLADADCILAVGIDDLEALADWRLAPVIDLEPGHLGPLAERWRRPPTDIEPPPLRSGLASITRRGWQATSAPLPPTRVTLHYSQLLGGGVVAADPGAAGYWVARTFGTTGLGGAQVPADPDSVGFAVACAAVSRLLHPSRPALAVVDRVDGRVRRVRESAERLGVPVAIEHWRSDGDVIDADTHLARLETLLRDGGTGSLAVSDDQLPDMLDLAGPIVAWTSSGSALSAD